MDTNRVNTTVVKRCGRSVKNVKISILSSIVFLDAFKMYQLKNNCMETKNLNFNGLELPPSMGYGILDEKSVKYENEELFAEYVFECSGSVVHIIKWTKERCEFETFLHGESKRFTVYPTLKQALLYDCMHWNLQTDDCYQFLSGKIIKLGNIYVNHPNADGRNTILNYFPAGKLFLLSLPLLVRTDKYLDFLEQVKGSKLLSFFRERHGHLLQLNQESIVTIQPIIVAEFIVTLAHLFNAAKEMVAAGVIDKSKILRLIVNESYEAANSLMQTFSGDSKNPYFSIVFKEFPSDKFEGLSELFLLQVEDLERKYHQV